MKNELTKERAKEGRKEGKKEGRKGGRPISLKGLHEGVMQSLDSSSGSEDDAHLLAFAEPRRMGLLDSDNGSSDETVKSETSEDRAFIVK